MNVSVCLSVCPFAYLKKYTSKFHAIFCTCYTGPWLGPPLTTLEYVTYFRFLRMTSYFPILGPIVYGIGNIYVSAMLEPVVNKFQRIRRWRHTV